MSFEKNMVDDFFRDKAEAFDPAVIDQDSAWQAMNKGLPSKIKHRKIIRRRIIKYMGGLALVTTVSLFTYNNSSHKKKKQPQQLVVKPEMEKSAQRTLSSAVQNNSANIIAKVVGLNKKQQNGVKRRVVQKRISIDTVLLTSPVMVEKNDQQLLKNFYDGLLNPSQEFVIDPSKQNKLVCKKGSRLEILPNTFVNENGENVSDSVKITVNEFYNYADMLSAGLSTKSGDEQLVSGGMLYINANTNGKKAMIRSGKEVILSMPSEHPDEEMRLFIVRTKDSSKSELQPINYSNNLDWVPATCDESIGRFYTWSYQPNEMVKLFDFRYDSYDERFGKKSIGQFYIAEACPYSDKLVKELIRQRYDIAEEIKLKRIGASDQLRFEKEKTAIYLAKTGPGKADSLTISFQQALSMHILSIQDSINYVFSRESDSLAFLAKRIQDSLTFVANQIEDLLKNGKRYAFEKKYSFSLKDFGWINCDHLFTDTLPRVEFVIETGDGFKFDDGYSFNLVFKNFRSIMKENNKDGKVIFSRVPVNQPVSLIAVGVRDGKTVSCIRSFTTAAMIVKDLTFSAVTPEKFKAQVAELDSTL